MTTTTAPTARPRHRTHTTPTTAPITPAPAVVRPRRRTLSARVRSALSRALTRLAGRLMARARADAARETAAVLAALAPALAATHAASAGTEDPECQVCAGPGETVVSVDGVPVVVCRVCAVLPAAVLADRTRSTAARRSRRDLRAVA